MCSINAVRQTAAQTLSSLLEVLEMRAKMLTVMAGGLIMAAGPMLAHHSFSAEYDRAKNISLKGTVTKVEWMNPHARFYLDVKDDGGKTTNWEFELGSPNGLMRQGWTAHSLKVGDVRGRYGIPGKGRLEPGQRQQRSLRERQAGSGRRLLGGRPGHEVIEPFKGFLMSARLGDSPAGVLFFKFTRMPRIGCINFFYRG